MTTITDAATTAANVGGDQNPEATGLSTPAVTSMVNHVVVTSMVNSITTPIIPRGPFNHHECTEKFTRVNFKRW
ncbi:hypothetical protein CsSME_00006648 [Camellia sinensis var. sinensis]